MPGRKALPLSPVPFTENVIPQLLAWRRDGIASALVTLVTVEGSSPRRTGSQMAVNARGEHLGYISSGCAEAAIVAEAVTAIEAGAARTVRYGAGSKYIDVVLPCGSGIDVHFDPAIETSKLERLQTRIDAREPAALTIGDGFARPYNPAPRVVIAGRGVNLDFVARFARDLEWDVVVASPDEEALSRLNWANARHLSKPDDFDAGVIDGYTAVVLLFHDHDWEPAILAKCAASPAFYVGALGSRRTHAERRMLLAARGCDAAFIDRIKSPIGLDIGAKNPSGIALAIMAEILSLAPQD